MGADNQQERLDPKWISGFVDGEGCFYIGINKMPKMKAGFQVLPEFRVVQHHRDVALLYQIQNFFGFGSVTKNNGDRDEFRVRGIDNLEKIVQFFMKRQLQSVKKHSLQSFAFVLQIIRRREHLTYEGVRKIAKISSLMNRKIPRKI